MMTMRRERTKKMVLIANFLAIAIVLNIIESMITIIPVPGAKIGFANIVTLIIIYIYGYKEAVAVTLLRVFLVAILSPRGLGPTFYLGISGAALSLAVMCMVHRLNLFGKVGISVLGAFSHSIGQIIAAIFVIGSAAVVTYLPIMLFVSIPAGFLTGVIALKFIDVWTSTHNEKT